MKHACTHPNPPRANLRKRTPPTPKKHVGGPRIPSDPGQVAANDRSFGQRRPYTGARTYARAGVAVGTATAVTAGGVRTR